LARTAPSADAAWQLSYLGSGASQLNSVAAISQRDAWAAGYCWITAAVGTSLQACAGNRIDGLARIPGSTQWWEAGAAPVSGDSSSAMMAGYN
jgi:hypothetical protein